MEVLPNDLVRECLLRVAYTSHDNLKAVCRSWEAMVSNPKFYADRKISGKSEQLLCLIQRDPLNREVFVIMVHDPVKGTRERLPPIDDPRFVGLPGWCQCIVVNQKLVIIGGLYQLNPSLKFPCLRNVLGSVLVLCLFSLNLIFSLKNEK